MTRTIPACSFLLGSLFLASCARGEHGALPSDTGGGNPIQSPSGSAAAHGLVSAVGAPRSVRVDWSLVDPSVEVALFRAAERSEVYAGPPVAENLRGTHRIVGGLPDGVDQYFGLGVREAGESSWTPVGAILSARPGEPIYVDAAATLEGADGATPETAFPDILRGVLKARFQGGGNVWVRDGEYGPAPTMALVAGVHVYGGFARRLADPPEGVQLREARPFDLSRRNAGAGRTVVSGPPGAAVFLVQSGEQAAVVDGIRFRGDRIGRVAIDVVDSSVELRSVVVTSFNDRGVRLRNSSLDDRFEVVIASSSFLSNGADGVSAAGAFGIVVDGSSFESNGQEGLDIDDLIALDGETASLRVDGSSFVGNAAEGLDVDLAPEPGVGLAGGRFAVAVRGSRFELNGRDGLLIDEDYERTPWSADIVVRECSMRANGMNGLRIDADARAELLVHRVLATGNGRDGIWVSSESQPGMVVVSASVLSGNMAAGMRTSLGNHPAAATHCVFAGNFGGGFASEQVGSSAASCVAYLQPEPWQGVHLESCVTVDDPQAGTFEHAPEAYERVLFGSGRTLTLSRGSSVPPGASVEVADDGIALSVLESDVSRVVLDARPGVFLAPALLSVFAPRGAVSEDYRLPPGSPAEARGMTLPGGPLVDAGVWGGPDPGEPGRAAAVPRALFRVAAAEPPLTAGVAASQGLEIVFSHVLEPSSVVDGRVRAISASGVELEIDFMPLDDRILVSPPAAGWGDEPFTLELHAGLRDEDGVSLATPVSLPFFVR